MVVLLLTSLSNKQGDNVLTGPIPTELGLIESLQDLNIGECFRSFTTVNL